MFQSKSENSRIWDLSLIHGPHIDCTVHSYGLSVMTLVAFGAGQMKPVYSTKRPNMETTEKEKTGQGSEC